jgi:hypothetical protein
LTLGKSYANKIINNVWSRLKLLKNRGEMNYVV